jgi:hypothetical protein
VNKLLHLGLLALAGLVVLAAAGPTLTKLAGALVPLVLVVGVVVAALRLVWWMTGPR